MNSISTFIIRFINAGGEAVERELYSLSAAASYKAGLEASGISKIEILKKITSATPNKEGKTNG